jgi:hypothetical protein
VNYVIFPVLATSSEGRRIQSLVADNLFYPAFIFVYNKTGSNAFNRGSIIDRLEGQISIDVFRDTLIKNIEAKENFKKNITPSNGTIIQQQKEEIEYLEKLENEKKLIEREQIIKAQKDEEEQKIKKKEVEEKKIMKQKIIPPEPSNDDVNSTLIIFRFPDGDGRVQRRFSKNDLIQV